LLIGQVEILKECWQGALELVIGQPFVQQRLHQKLARDFSILTRQRILECGPWRSGGSTEL
jgi:hypothetical protein